MKIITLILLVTISVVRAQENLVYNLDNTYVNPYGSDTDLVSYSPTFKLIGDIIHNQDKSHNIKKFPNAFNKSNAAYAFIYFTGTENSRFEREAVILIEDYVDLAPKLYVDFNGNLDFTDDGAAIVFNNTFILKLANSKDDSAIYNYSISKSGINPQYEERFKSRYAPQYPKSEILSTKHWLTEQRHNVKISKKLLNNKPITIFLFDNDVDGAFTFDTTDYGDRIYIAEGHLNINQNLIEYNRLGEPIDNNAIFEIYSNNYYIEKFNIDGSQISLNKSNKKPLPKFKKGTNVSSFSIKFLDGKSVSIKDYIEDNTHLLIDVGGTWCGGCIAQEPLIKSIYKNNLAKVIGIFGYDTESSVTKYVNSHNIKWPVALMSSSFKELFRTNSYPTYILISPQGEILSMEMDAQKIIQILSEN